MHFPDEFLWNYIHNFSSNGIRNRKSDMIDTVTAYHDFRGPKKAHGNFVRWRCRFSLTRLWMLRGRYYSLGAKTTVKEFLWCGRSPFHISMELPIFTKIYVVESSDKRFICIRNAKTMFSLIATGVENMSQQPCRRNIFWSNVYCVQQSSSRETCS